MLDFIYLFKTTWNKYYADEHLAERQIKFLETIKNSFKEKLLELRKISSFIEYNIGIFPNEETDKKASEFNAYISNDYTDKRSIIVILSRYVIDSMEYYYERAVDAYERRNFKEVECMCKTLMQRLTEYDEKFHTRFVKMIGKYPTE